MKAQPMIGLEIHGYLQTKEKLFCNCKAIRHGLKQDLKPNTFICPICTGSPGSKPMLPNFEAIKKIIQIGLMLKCKINVIENKKSLVWQRKHYDWPDLPKGYQDTISGSYSIPVCENGKFNNIRITEAHLEEDPAAWNPETGNIDYNRSGLPLVEIVTAPDFQSAEQVITWLKQLLLVLSYIKAVDKNAGIKADVNVSIKNKTQRVEIKNMSSLENIKKAINYEIQRQLNQGSVQETRRFDPIKEITIKMRSKEQAQDYRFIPDPDLPVININNKLVNEIKKNLPESPQEKLEKIIKKLKIPKTDAEILTNNLEIAEFFEQVSKKINPNFALKWITIELFRVLKYNKKTLDEVDIKVEHFTELLSAVKNKKVTQLKAKQILNTFYPKSYSISKKKDLTKISERDIKQICEKVVKNNAKVVQDYKQGKEESFNFLMGQVMILSERRADYKITREILEKMLK